MKNILATIVLALAFVASAFAVTVTDANGATVFTQNSSGVLATNISGVTQNVRFVQPGLEINFTLAPGEARQVGTPAYGFYEWTCPAGYVAVIQGTNTLPTYENHNQTMSCR